MKAPRLAGIVTCLGLLLAGCGGSSDDETTAEPTGGATASASAEASREPSPEATPEADESADPTATATASGTRSPAATSELTKAEAKRLATAGVLTKADLAGYDAEVQTQDPDDDAAEKKGNKCLGLDQPTYRARNLGTAFTKGDLEIDSSADVAESESAAREEIRAWQSKKAVACVKDQFTDMLAGSGAAITEFTLEQIDVTVKGADDTFGFRMAITVGGPGGSATLNGFLIGALVGPVEISVSSLETESSAFTLKDVSALAAIAAGRVKKAL